jgi:hypothetical protein
VDATFFSGEAVAVTAPGPVFRFFHQTFFDGIAMDVAEFFDELSPRDDVEIVLTALPEVRTVAFEALRCFGLQGPHGVGQ